MAPPALTSQEYTDDLNQVEDLGRIDSTTRTPDQTIQARFWTDHDIRQWNDGMLRLAAARGLDLVQTARMLAMAHVAGGDAMIACFDAKYHYWFWRPFQAIPLADTDGNTDTEADPTWTAARDDTELPGVPVGARLRQHRGDAALGRILRHRQCYFYARQPRHPHNPQYDRFHDVVEDVDWARVLVGFHFLSSDQQGSPSAGKVGDYVANHFFQPLRRPHEPNRPRQDGTA